jgi:hypothetical protein
MSQGNFAHLWRFADHLTFFFALTIFVFNIDTTGHRLHEPAVLSGLGTCIRAFQTHTNIGEEEGKKK